MQNTVRVWVIYFDSAPTPEKPMYRYAPCRMCISNDRGHNATSFVYTHLPYIHSPSSVEFTKK